MAALRQDGLRPDYESNTTALSIVYRNVGELKIDPRNPRRHSKKQVKQIARSIQTFGFTVPLILDENLRVISGHGRLAAARLLGIDQVPTICVAHLNEAQIRAFQIADNQLTDNSNWDKKLLSKQLQNLTDLKLDFSIESTGFELPQIELLIANTESVRKKVSTKSESFSDSEPFVAVTRPGDLWALGRHRLVCGSPCQQQTYSTVMDGDHAAVVFTHLSGDAAGTDLVAQILSQAVEHCTSDALHFVVSNGLGIMNVVATAERVGLAVTDLCVAVKTAAQPGPLYHQQADFIAVLRNGEIEHLSKPQFERSNVWRDPSAASLRRRPVTDARCEVGQHELPLALVAEAIAESSAPGGIVLDPNLNGGITLLAAEQTGRICHAIGSDSQQIDRVIRNWQQVTGEHAVHGQIGRSFDVVREERRVQ
jgi:ParB-like nuclease family protein